MTSRLTSRFPFTVDPLPGPAPVQVAVDSGAARGAASGGAASEGAETGGAEPRGVETGGGEPRGAEPEGVEPGGAASEGAESGGAQPQGAASYGGSAGASSSLSLQQLCGWFVWRTRLWSGASGAGGAGPAGAGCPGVAARAGVTGGAATTGLGGARTRGTRAARTGGVEGTGAGHLTKSGTTSAGGVGAGGARFGGPGTGGARAGGPGVGGAGAGGAGAVDPSGAVRPRPHSRRCSRPLLYLFLLLTLSSPAVLQSVVSLRLVLSRLLALLVAFLVRVLLLSLARTLCPSSVPLRVPLPAPRKSSLPQVPDSESDRGRAASPSVSRLLATAVTHPSFESAAASALVAELLDFADASRLDYATALVAESASASPPSIRGECALDTDVLEDRQEDFECLAAAVPCFASMLLAPEGDSDAPDIPTPSSYAEAIEGPYSSQWQAAMDAKMASWKSTSTYVDEVPPPGANIVSGMWIFRVLLHIAAHRDYELHSLDFSIAFLQGGLHEEIWLRRPPGFTGSFLVGTQWSLQRPVYGLRQAPCEWHDTLRTTLAVLGTRPREVLQRFGFTYSSPQSTPLPTGHSLSALALDESVEPSGPYPELVGCLMYLMTCTRPDLAYPLSLLARYVAPGRHRKVHWDAAKRVLRYLCSTSGMGLVLEGRARVVLTGHADASWVDDLATQWSSQGYTFSLGSGSVSWRSTRSSSVLSSSCEAEIYAGAMAAQELRWLTYLLTDLGEAPRSPPVLHVDNKAMLALCEEHSLEHRTKHIALRYFLARELQQCGQLRLAYVASQANTADAFTKVLQPCDHQRYCTVLGLVPTVPHLLTS
ncbi:unnamed protein product [Closterium sp. NIES-53]